jgi:F-type H+-transporting ATPase subunit delta
MKIPKEAKRTARHLLRATTRTGRLDLEYARKVVQILAEKKPRHYMAILSSYQRMLRNEVDQRHAVIESSTPLSSAEQTSVLAELQKKCGSDVTCDFRVNPELLGGMRVKLGSNVWDGSLKNRIASLRDSLTA